MAEYIDKEKVLSTLENTAKYYEMPNADEWTKGIHYGLIHGVDNIVDNVPIEDVVEREKIDDIKAEIDKLYVYHTTEKGSELISKKAVYRAINFVLNGSRDIDI